VTKQIEEVIGHLSAEQMKNIVIAYEPVWAIGTGVTASNEQAQEMHAHIRSFLNTMFGEVSNDIQILYGGSMNAANAQALLACEDVDGGLIGGASLKVADFEFIYKA
jgi:triosephosphate isomerase